MQPEPQDIQLLAQVGFLAAGRGDMPQALRIFEALALLRPVQAFAFVGLASALMNAGRAHEAVQRLQTVRLPAGPEADMLDSFKSLALQLAGRRGESTYLLRQIAMRSRHTEPSAGALLASRLLGEDLAAAPRQAPLSTPSF